MPREIRWVVSILLIVFATGCTRESSQPPASKTHPNADYAGYLQAVHNKQIIGWAWDKSRPDEAIDVTILDGTNILATVKADSFRQDLLDGKRGNGKHGFAVPMPQNLNDGQPHEIHAVISGTNFELKNSPKLYQFQPKKPGK